MARRDRDLSPAERYDLFLVRANELRVDRRLGRSGLETLQLTLTATEATVTSVDEDDLRAFLTTLRLFLSDREPTHALAILNLMERVDNADLRRAVAAARNCLRTAAIGDDTVRMTFTKPDGSVITTEGAFDLYANVKVFHSGTRAERQTFGDLEMSFADWIRFAILKYVADTMSCVQAIAQLITDARVAGVLQ